MRRPIEAVMKQINQNLEDRGLPTHPEPRLRVIAQRHLDDVEFGTFIVWKRREARKENAGAKS